MSDLEPDLSDFFALEAKAWSLAPHSVYYGVDFARLIQQELTWLRDPAHFTVLGVSHGNIGAELTIDGAIRRHDAGLLLFLFVLIRYRTQVLCSLPDVPMARMKRHWLDVRRVTDLVARELSRHVPAQRSR